MRTPGTPVFYKTFAALSAVKLQEHPGSTLRDPTGSLIEIPKEAVIQTEGSVARSGLINILWNDQAFSVFFEDLQERAKVVTAAGQ